MCSFPTFVENVVDERPSFFSSSVTTVSLLVKFLDWGNRVMPTCCRHAGINAKPNTRLFDIIRERPHGGGGEAVIIMDDTLVRDSTISNIRYSLTTRKQYILDIYPRFRSTKMEGIRETSRLSVGHVYDTSRSAEVMTHRMLGKKKGSTECRKRLTSWASNGCRKSRFNLLYLEDWPQNLQLHISQVAVIVGTLRPWTWTADMIFTKKKN